MAEQTPTDDLRTRIERAIAAEDLVSDTRARREPGYCGVTARADAVLAEVEPVLAQHRDTEETLRADMRSMVVDLHAAQFDGATSLPDRPLDTTWAWLLDLVRKDRARLSAGSPTIPDDARTQLRDYLTGWLPARLSVPYDDTVEEIAMALAVSLVDDVLSEWSAATPKADGAGDLRGTLTALAADFRNRAEQTSLAYDEGEAPEDDCDSPAECHASARYLTWKLAARALEKAMSAPVPPSGATDPAPAPTEGGPRWSPGDYVEYDCEWHGRTVAVPGFVTGDAYPATGGVHRMTVQTGRLMVGEVYMADTALRVPRTVTKYCGAFDVDVPDVSMKPCQEKALPQSNRCARHAEDAVLLAVAEDRALHDTGDRHELDDVLDEFGVDEATTTPTEDGRK